MQQCLWVAALTTFWGGERGWRGGHREFACMHVVYIDDRITARVSSYICTGYCRYSIVFFRNQPRLLYVCEIIRHCSFQHAGEDESCKISTHPLFSKCAVVGYMFCLC